MKAGLATIRVSEHGIYSECSFLIMKRENLNTKNVSKKVYNVFAPKFTYLGEKDFDAYCQYGKMRGSIVFCSDDIEFAAK